MVVIRQDGVYVDEPFEHGVNFADDVQRDMPRFPVHPDAVLHMDLMDSQNVLDKSTRENDGTITGVTTWKPDGLDLEGDGNYIAVLDTPSIHITGRKTLMVWFKTTDATVRQSIITKHDLDVNIYVYETSYIRYGISTVEGGWKSFFGSNTLQSDTWYFTVLVFNSSEEKLYGYLDGTQDGTPKATAGATVDTDTQCLEFGIRNTTTDQNTGWS